jgi:hypothetical protein
VNNGASATYAGGGSILGTVPSLTATTVTFNNIAQALSTSPTYFFLIADVSGAATPQNFNTTFTNATVDAAGVSGFGFTEGPISITSLETTFAPLSAGLAPSPLVEGSTDQAILGFSATSNGSSTLSAISFPVSPTGVDLTDYFASIKLYASANATFDGGDAEIVDGGGYTVDLTDPNKIIITNLAQTITSSTKNYFLVANIASNISAIRGTRLKVSLPDTEITITGSATVSSAIESINHKFLYAQSSVVTVSYPGQGSLTLGEYSYQGALNSTAAGERLFGVNIADSDTDTKATKVTSLTFEFGDPTNIDSVALFANGTATPIARAKVSDVIDGSNRITFNLTPPSADATDNGSRTYEIYVSFVDSVADNDVLSVKLYAAVADTTQGSGLASFGTLQTTAGNNDIVINATVLEFDPSIIAAITPNTPFSAIVYATDVFGNRDVDFSEQANISESGGSGSLTGGGFISPVNGIYTFPALSIDAAGNYLLTTNDAGGGSDLVIDTSPLSVTSLGVKITNGSMTVFNRNICFGRNTYDSLGAIKIQEQDRGDFVSGGYYMFQLPAGFIFNTAKAPVITESGNEVTLNPFGTTSGYYVGSNVFRFKFTITGTTDPTKDAITIKGLEVIPDSTYTGVAGGAVYALDAGSVMVGNTEADALSHGTLNVTNADATNFDFVVSPFPGQTDIVPEETQFSYTTFGILLKPKPSNPASSYPVFQGNGVSYSSTQGAYVFSPSSVGVGNNYNVSFTTRETSTGCKVTRTKVFVVYATSISGLLTEYCENDSINKSLNVDPDRYSVAKYYTPWSNAITYSVGNRVSSGGNAYECIASSTNNVPPNAAYWKLIGYTFSNEYSVSIPSYKVITSVDNDGAGTITITSPNHGFNEGAKLYLGYYVYDANWNVVFSIPYPTGDTTTYYQINSVTANTFKISYSQPTPAVYSNGYGYIYIRNPQVTGVSYASNVVTITVPNHGLSTGATVRVYLDGLSDNGGTTTRIDDWYPITKINNNSFTITTSGAVSLAWTGYGYVDIFTYKIDDFNPAMAKTLNTNFGTVTNIYVGFLVHNIGCVEDTYNTCAPLIYSNEPVKLNQLADLDFVGLNASGQYCANSTPVNLTGNQADGSFVTGNGVSDGGANNNTGTFNPSLSPQGSTFPITYNYTDSKNCSASISKNVIVNVTPARPDTVQSQFGYCLGDTQPLILKVTGTGSDFAWYNNASKTTLLGNGPVYDATSEGSGSPKTVSFFATQFSLGCESNTRQVDLVINPLPDADFTNIGQCAKDTITFKGSKVNIASWDWDFGDGVTAGGTADSTVTHVYGESRTFTVRLNVKSKVLAGNATCTNSSFINLFIGFNPTIDVKYQRICDGDVTQFTHTSSPPLDTISWNFGDGPTFKGKTSASIVAPATSGTYGSPNHTYPGADTYTLTMIGKTSIGCVDTVVKVVPILRKLTPTSTSPYLMKTIDPSGESGYWQVETTVDSLSTWEFNTLTGTTMQSTDSAWVTGASIPYKSNDLSYVNSPCFNLTGFARPLISIDYMNDTQNGRDGAILEYSTNSGLTWTKLGNPKTGLEWYDEPNPVNALGNVFGWTGKDTTFQSGFHSLSDIPLAQRTNVRFRIKFASDQDTEGEGFAFNNVNIVEKNRLVLVENFTNNSKTETVNHNTIFRNLSSYLSPSEYVPLEYHIVPAGFGSDAINDLNKADNNARAAFYGITQNVTGTQDGLLMGMFNNIPAATNLKQSFEDEFNLRSLRSSPLQLDIVTSNTAGGQYKVDVTIIPQEDILSNEPIALYVALVEKVLDDPEFAGANGETQYHYVLRRMLPNAAGKRLTFPLVTGIPVVFSDTITITDNLFTDVNEMAIVAFVQNQNIDNEGRKDVWQAQIEESPIAPTTVTGLEPLFGDLVNIYPVPSRGRMNIELPEKVKHTIPMSLVDNFGREVYVNQFKPGERLKTVDTKELASGVYILQIVSEKGELFRRKVVITND